MSGVSSSKPSSSLAGEATASKAKVEPKMSCFRGLDGTVSAPAMTSRSQNSVKNSGSTVHWDLMLSSNSFQRWALAKKKAVWVENLPCCPRMAFRSLRFSLVM
eukprot:maker-scaffold130_size324016-snap-gene-0.14 protein:Tk07094 transcript:maker-scaffold130_size324016-snap-gene-0.14-mRNA-1 annotation:"hypothetical protein GGTG_09560"